MKKITLFFASMLVCMGAWAQTAVYLVTDAQLASGDLNAKTEPTMIAIKNLSATNNRYFVGNTGAVPYSKAEFNTNGEAVFVWEPVTEGTPGSYYLKKLDGTYMQATAPTAFGDKATAAVFTTTNPTSTGTGSTKFNGDGDSQNYINGNDDPNLVRFVNGAGTWINVQNGGSGTPLYNSGQGGWTIHYVYEVGTSTAYDVTYNFKYNDEVIATQTSEVIQGAAYPDYKDNVVLPYGFVAAAKPEGTVEEAKTIEVELTVGKELPFEAAENVEGITKWYFVKLYSKNPKYIQALEDGTIEWADTEVAEGEEESHLWGFVGDVWGMKMVSKTGKAIVSTSGAATLGDAAQANAFAVTVCRSSEEAFCLQYADKEFLNGQNGAVKSWWDNDEGSAFLVEEYSAPVVEPEYLTVVGANVGDVAIVEGVATVSSISTIDVTFDRPVAKGAGWATLTDPWETRTLNAEVLKAEEGSSEYVVRFSIWEWEEPYTTAYDYILTIPEGLIVGAEDANYINAEMTATITIEAGGAPVTPATPLAVTNVTVGEDVMEGFTAVATPTDMIKVNFDGEFYFQGMPAIVDAEGNDASDYFQFMNGMDADGSNSYIFMAQNWQGTAPAGIYTITLPKASFMEYASFKAPAEDIVLTVEVLGDTDGIDNIDADAETVIYDLSGRRVEKMEKGIYIVNGRKVVVK